MLEPSSVIARRFDMDEIEMDRILDSMSKKGLIIRSSRGGQNQYMAAQFVVGIWEYHVNDLDEELIKDFNAYVPYLMKSQLSLKTQQLRVIPVSKSISAEMRVMPYDQAEQIIKTQSKIVVAPCICRKEHKMVGKGCDNPEETCLIFGGSAYYYEGNGIGRVVTQEEALEQLESNHKKGYAFTMWYKDATGYRAGVLCSCCSCCCAVFSGLLRFGMFKHILSSESVQVTDHSKCTDCGLCIDSCHFGAREVFDGQLEVNKEMCYGCGLCVGACPEEVINIESKV